ncbi:MAG: hypothetical protein AAFR36_22010 [Bacteroidota bacterium]
MKHIANLLWAFLVTFLIWALLREWLGPANQDDYRHWIYRIPFSIQVLFWWALFSFPKSASQVSNMLGGGLMNFVSYGASGAGNLIAQLWKFRAGQIAVGSGIAYLIYYLFF